MAYENSRTANGYKEFDRGGHHSGKEEQMGMGVTIVVFALASMIGLWGFSCIASGIFHSGGLFGLGSSWVSAVFGM